MGQDIVFWDKKTGRAFRLAHIARTSPGGRDYRLLLRRLFEAPHKRRAPVHCAAQRKRLRPDG
jgi:hypothetical protein